jgi:hypothetical protein
MIALTALFSLAAPIPQAARAAFLQALAAHHEIGAGLLYRVGRSLQLPVSESAGTRAGGLQAFEEQTLPTSRRLDNSGNSL